MFRFFFSFEQAIKCDKLLLVLHGGNKSGEKYSEETRQFCLALHYHSPRAYEYVRKVFHNHLPHPKTIQQWYANSDVRGDPGLQEDTMRKLGKIARQHELDYGCKLLCSLVFDEMHIRTQVFWNLQQLKYVGFQTYDENPNNEQKRIAKQAIVFFLNGINANFEFPVAYFLIDSLKKEPKKILLEQIINAVSECGVRITNLTFDGFASNIPMAEMFGANLDVTSPEFQPYFINPANSERIYIILDPCHMEKLLRNTLAGRKVIYDSKNRKIEWRFIEALHNQSKENGLRTHNLSKKHMQWHKNSMNVRLAVQTLSESVANSIMFFRDQKLSEFENSDATIEFIKIVNSLFDIFNTRHTKNQNIFKRALNIENKRVIFDFLKKCIAYFQTLKIDEKGKKISVLRSNRKTAFRGFIICMYSAMLMFTELIEEKSLLTFLPTYYILQDVIEMFFGKIRACCGYNNNPNIHQFKGAYRKLQANIKVQPSKLGNCRYFDIDLPNNLNFSDIYFVSSRRPTIAHNEYEELFSAQKDAILEEVIKLDIINTGNHLLDVTADFSTAYIASQIEKKIMNCPRFYCVDCQSVLHENSKANIPDSGILDWIPTQSSFQICKTVEKFFKLFDIRKKTTEFDFKILYIMIFRSMDLESLYSSSKFECDINHKYQFIKCVVGQYISKRAAHVSQDITYDQYDTINRHYFMRKIIEGGK